MVTFNDADEFFQTAAEGGNAFRLQDIDGIGPATEDKIMSVRGISTTEDVKEMSADELADKANISRSRAKKAISGLGGNPSVSKRSQNNLANTSAAGVGQPQGDFLVDFAELDKARAKNDARSRSEEAVRTDDRKRAPVTTNYDKWKGNKSRWDFPGVDTPTQEPDLLPKDVKAGNPETTDFESRDERIRERNEQSFPRKEKKGRVLQQQGNRILAADVAGDIPEGTVPGVAPTDFEQEPALPGFDSEAKRMGPDPSSQRLPQGVRDNLAAGESADLAFSKAERQRKREGQSGGGMDTNSGLFDFDLSEKSTDELEGLNDFYKRNIEGEVDSMRAKGGSAVSEFAQDYSQKQIAIQRELESRMGF